MASFVHLIDQRRLIGPGGSTTSGEIYFYYTGTTVKAPIFSDAALLIPLSNPVVVGAGAIIPLIFLNDAIQYRRVIQYADGSIDEQDPIGNLFSDGDIGLPVGSVIDYSGESPPSGFLFCFGQEISRTDYSELFDTIGTQYGPGNGSTTFNLPDYRGRVGAGKDNMGGSAAGRLATQLTGSILGSVGGEEGHVLTIAELAAHTHGITITDPGHSHGIPVYGDGNSGNFIEDAGGGTLKTITSNTATTGITATAASQGSSTAHNNVQPTIVINKIIKTASVSFLSLFGINLAEEAASAVASIEQAAAAVQAGIENYYVTIAEGVANTAVGGFFASPETGTVRIYLRTATAPYYADQGDSVAPVTKEQLSASEDAAAQSAAEAAAQASAVAAAMNSSSAPYANAYASTLPKGVTSTSITAAGTGGTSGTYALGVSGGPTGFAGTYTISGGGVTAITITNPGLSTTATAPTLSFPSGSVTGATATATVSTLVADQRTYWVASSDSSQILLYGNNGGSVATAPFGGTQLVLYGKAAIDTLFSRFSFNTSSLYDLGLTPDGVGIVAGFYDDQSTPNMLLGIDANGRALLGGAYIPQGSTITHGREITTALSEQNYPWLLQDPSGNPLTGFNSDDNSFYVPTLRASTDILVGGSSYLDNIASLRKDRLTRWRAELSKLADGESVIASLGLIGDSWTYFSSLFTPRLQSRLRAAYGDGGDGFIAFATSSGIPSAPAAVSRTSSAVFVITKPVGTWTENSTYTAPTANLCETVSAASGNRLQIAATGASVNTVFKLLYRPIAGSSVRYSWNGGSSWETTLDLSTGYVATLANVPGTGTWTLLIEDNGASARCALTGLNARKASGVLVHKVGSPGSTAAQWAAQAGTAGFQAHWAELAPDAVSILLGSNDQTVGALGTAVAANYTTIRNGVRTGVPWTNEPPVDMLYAVPAENRRTSLVPMSTYASAIRTQALTDGAAYLSLQYALGTPAASSWWADTLHPNETYGGPAMARAFLETLDR